MVGIYKITNPEGFVYIGQTLDWLRRERDYKALKCRTQYKLYNSLLKYGWFHHKFELIHELPSDINKSILDNYEKLYISQYKSNGTKYPEVGGLNLTDGGKGVSGSSFIRKAKKKSNTLLGIPKSDEHKRKISEALKGRKLSEEHKNKLRKNVHS